jgi:hypothetical protein
VDDGNESDESTSKFSDFGDSGTSVEWTEESSDEDLDYFAALDVVAAEASPRAVDYEVVPGPSAGRRRRRAVAKRRVSEADGGRLRVGRVGRQELLSLPTVASAGEGELQSLFAGEELRIIVTPQVLPWLEHTLALRTMIICGRDLRNHKRTLEIMC